MPEPAIRRMTLADFLVWEDGTDTRYEFFYPAGVMRLDRAEPCYGSDITVIRQSNRCGRQWIEEPILTFETLSPGTERHDRHTMVPGYREIARVREIVRLDSKSQYAEVLRRDGDRTLTELVQGAGARPRLNLVDSTVAMAELYKGIEIVSESTA